MYVGNNLFIKDDITVDTNLNILGIATVGILSVTTRAHVNGDTEIAGISTVLKTTVSTSPTTGALVVNGGVGVGGSIHLGDSKGILFGAGDDLQILHDHVAGDSYIVDAGTGALKIDASQKKQIIHSQIIRRLGI